MTSNEAYNIAIKLGDIAMRNIQLFITICVAFGGWVLTSDAISQFELFGWERILIIVVFTLPTAGMVAGFAAISKRVNAAFALSKEIFETEKDQLSDNARPMFALGNMNITIVSMSSAILMIDLLVLLYQKSDFH